MITVSVFNLQVRLGSRNSEAAIVHGANEATPKTGGTLRIGLIAALPSNLNPLVFGLSTATTMEIFSNMFSGLTRFNETGMVVPDLAENWEISADGCNYTFHLFQNVTWHDGFRFNASDVKYTYDQILYNPEASESYNFTLNFNLASVEVLDEFTVLLNLAHPNSAFPAMVGYIPIIPQHLYNGTDLATNPYNDSPVGTGPFKFDSWNPGVELTLVAHDMYHRGRPYLDKVTMVRYMNGTALAEALMNNAIDMIPYFVDPNEVDNLRQVVGTSVLDVETPNIQLVGFNYSNPIFGDLKVREALSCAINRSEICESAFLGCSTPAKGPVPPILSYWINPNLPDIVYDKSFAEQLLDEAGYPRNNGTGLRFNLTLMILSWNANCQWLWQACQKICSYWQDIGVNTTMQVGWDPKTWDVWFWNDAYGVNDIEDLRWLFYTDNSGPNFGYSNATVDNLFDQGILTSNLTLRKQIYDEMQTLLSEDVASIFLWHNNNQAAYNNDFHGFANYEFAAMASFVLEKVWYDRTLSGEGNCPYRVCFTDSEGRRTGFYDGMACEDIPNSTYSGIDSDPQLVKIREPSGNYTVELVGTEDGPYKFEFANMALDYKDFWVPEGFIYENQTVPFTVRVNEDGSIDRYWHNLGITGITPSKTVVDQNCQMNLNVSVSNWGNYTETFNVTVYANATTVATIKNLTLPAHNSTTVSCTWNTVYSASGEYSVSAYASPVANETNTADNTFAGGTVQVTPTYPASSGGGRKCVW